MAKYNGKTVLFSPLFHNGDHNELTNRDLANQHPMSAISGLPDVLDHKLNEPISGEIGSNTFLKVLGEDEQEHPILGYAEVSGGANYKLIEKIIVGYSVLTTEPADWETNYTAYYKNTGTTKEPIYTALTEAETFVAGQYYSYNADPITSIVRTTEPDGTPYSFNKFIIMILIPQNDTSNEWLEINIDISRQLNCPLGSVGHSNYRTMYAAHMEIYPLVFKAHYEYHTNSLGNKMLEGGEMTRTAYDFQPATILQTTDKFERLEIRRPNALRGGEEFYIYGVRA